jgi:hypothetical protein
MIRWLGTLFERLIGLLGALVLSQAPLFMLQYTHEMLGHVAELHRQVSSMSQVAMQGGKTLDAFIQKFLLSEDADFRAQGILMQGMVKRWHSLSEGVAALQHAAFWERPFVFFKHLDSGIVQDTYNSFEPGLPLTLEGGVYALAGLLLAIGLFRLLSGCLRGIFVRKRPVEAIKEMRQL